ncbi:MAG: M60 family metallopeptidase [Ruminococcus sp.]|nr:M60 family metallopeptidase [Ruminococcus sp.]
MKGSIRKRSLKRILAFVSALSMMGSFSQAIGASTFLSYNVISAAAEDNGDDIQEEKYSKIDIEISNQMDLNRQVNCTVSVFDASGKNILPNNTVVTVDGVKDSVTPFSTGFIKNGTYTVVIEAPGFKKFEQEVSKFDNMVCTVKVTLGFQRGYIYRDEYKKTADGQIELKEDNTPVIEVAKSDSHPGVMVYGDVDGNGEIGMDDATSLLRAIDYSLRNNGAFEKGYESLNADLNCDGEVNLADLTFFTNSYTDTRDWETTASIEKEMSEAYKIAALNKAKASEGTAIVEGSASLADLMKNSGTQNNETAEQPKMLLQPAPVMIPVTDKNGEPVFDEDGNQVFEEGEIPELSEDNPAGVDLDVENVKELSFGTNANEGWIDVEVEEGKFVKVPFSAGSDAWVGDDESDDNGGVSSEIKHLVQSTVSVKIDESGNIKIDLGNQIAVKKISLKISKVKNSTLAEIASVEMLNGMESRLAPPEIDYPTNVKVIQNLKVPDDKAKIEVTWDKPRNGTGKYEYEVSTSPALRADGSFSSTIAKNVVETDNFSLESEHGNFKLIKVNTTYYVHVRCVGESYNSSWSDAATVETKSTTVPDKPDYIFGAGGYQSINVTWGADKTNSATGYKLYYASKEEIDEKGNSAYKEVVAGKTTSYPLTMLEDKKEYNFYVVAYNEHGDSNPSDIKSAQTTVVTPIEMHKYGAINMDDEGNTGSTHIVSATRNGGDSAGNAIDAMNSSGQKTAWSVVDGDQASYYAKTTWDDGGFNNLGGNGITYEFDDVYEFGSVAVSRPYGETNFTYTKVRYWNEDGTSKEIAIYGNQWKTDANGRGYHVIKFPEKITTRKIQIGFANSWVQPALIAYSEIHFYAYDYAMEEILNLYIDDLHTVLKDDVTQETIDNLREKINTPDSISGEFNPEKEALERELDTAEKILNAEQISKAVEIHNGITTYDPTDGKSRNYSGLNAWQPLGVSVGTNTEVTIYVGSDKKKTGESTELRLICTQYNSESNGVELDGANLKIGANTFNLTKGNVADAEAGGSLYIQYCGGVDSQIHYSVRVTGGTEIPVLDLYNVTDRMERLNRAADYVEALEAHVANTEAEHNRIHKGATFKGNKNTKLDYDYNEKTCIAGAAEILGDTMMYSLPASQILAGLGKGSVEARAEKLVQSMDSMEDMMKLFYQHKGMSADAANVVDRIPNRHLNIRYQRMFSGAFMYAAGNHIGIQYGSASGMVNSPSVKSKKNGQYVSGSYFGWGIAHEIGHNLNDSSYADAEITNNYFSLLAQSEDKNEGSRLNYNNIFKKVSSGTKGKADQGTQLGLYWQLHLAYDKDYNFKTYNTNAEILENLFYARMDTYSRNPSKAPQPEEIALTLGGGQEQNLMRLACAAAEKNILEFFERWGMTPDGTTRQYASQFPKETRAIMYANEDSRVYAMGGESPLTINEDGTSASVVIDNVGVSVGRGAEANKVELSIKVSDVMPKEDILGYEIVRCTISGGDVKETPIGFTTKPEFTDTVTSFNNRTVSYKVTLIDQYLCRSVAFVTDMVKIQHDGSLDKTYWNISTDGLKAEEIVHDAEEDEMSCSRTIISPAASAIDNNLKTVYEPEVTADNAEIIMNFNESLVVTGMKYTAGNKENSVGEYKAYVMNEAGTNWVEVAEGRLNGSETVYFTNSDDKYISTYDTTAVKFEILNQNGKNISIAELDVLGVTGDNVDFRKDGEKAEAAFGILSEDYRYGTKENQFIPEGSLVFTGSYTGNPAYNAVILFDENGNIVGGTGNDDEGESNQIILADVPEGALITDVPDGTWIYWVNPEDIDEMYWPEKVRVELYRVNNALTNEGQRIVSDSLFEKLASKDKIAPISLGGNVDYIVETNTSK